VATRQEVNTNQQHNNNKTTTKQQTNKNEMSEEERASKKPKIGCDEFDTMTTSPNNPEVVCDSYIRFLFQFLLNFCSFFHPHSSPLCLSKWKKAPDAEIDDPALKSPLLLMRSNSTIAEEENDGLAGLPADVLKHQIARRLNPTDLIALSSTNSHLRKLLFYSDDADLFRSYVVSKRGRKGPTVMLLLPFSLPMGHVCCFLL